jgi:pimeloyl-ACP methyl ester carboxylesterase
MGHSVGALHSLPERIRAQTALDYKRTAPGAYHVLNVISDMTPYLSEIDVQTLVVWGDRDQTLSPPSFLRVWTPPSERRNPAAGHVPHQSDAAAFNRSR